ncbi:hypothetical protein V1460_06180 [Streptomyces sp. SCSIO 30461]|uniref:hypothetical protein n=1 Tax=Streptomyces sp. SCSIO 30461 TaxID=3118085 RepID=UPI0030D2BC56
MTLYMAAGFPDSTRAIIARSWPGRAFPPGPEGELTATVELFGARDAGVCVPVPDGSGIGAAVAVIS